jgi:hypothetical protein
MDAARSKSMQRFGAFYALMALAAACGGSSDSQINTGASGSSSTSGPGGSGSTGVGGSGSGMTTGTSGSADTDTGSGGSSATDSGVVVVPPGDGGACPSYASFTLAVQTTMDVTWAAATATDKGMGKVVLWSRSKLTATGTTLAGEGISCGTLLPDVTLNFLGSIAAGGSKVLVEIPTTDWDAPTMPKFPSNGSLAGWSVGSALSLEPNMILIGLTMPDPKAAWPASAMGIATVDADSDGKPGILAVPKSGGGYVQPPTAIGLGGSAPVADSVYLVSRTEIALNGKATSCEEQAGTAMVKYFDSHVVGCHVKGAAECNPTQADFIDQTRTVYQATAASFKSKKVADGATCADVRAALPL